MTLSDSDGKFSFSFSFSFESKIQHTIKKATKFLEGALDTLNEGKSTAITEVAEALYGNASAQTINIWKSMIEGAIFYAREFDASKNAKIIDDENIVARVNKVASIEYTKYIQTLARAKSLDLDVKEKKNKVSEINKNYKNLKNLKYMEFNKGAIKKHEARFGKNFPVTAVIHEFSHAVANTKDVIYVTAYKEKPNELSYHPLYLLARGEVPEEQQTTFYQASVQDYERLAQTNADTFAHATALLFYSTQKNRDKKELYRQFMNQKARNFRRPSVTH